MALKSRQFWLLFAMSSLSICKWLKHFMSDSSLCLSVRLLHGRCLQDFRAEIKQSKQRCLLNLGRIAKLSLHISPLCLVCHTWLPALQTHLWSASHNANCASVHNGLRHKRPSDIPHMDLPCAFLRRRPFHDCSKHGEKDLRRSSNFPIWYYIDIYGVCFPNAYCFARDGTRSALFAILLTHRRVLSCRPDSFADCIWREQVCLWRWKAENYCQKESIKNKGPIIQQSWWHQQ